jgi:hypothetical protein
MGRQVGTGGDVTVCTGCGSELDLPVYLGERRDTGFEPRCFDCGKEYLRPYPPRCMCGERSQIHMWKGGKDLWICKSCVAELSYHSSESDRQNAGGRLTGREFAVDDSRPPREEL